MTGTIITGKAMRLVARKQQFCYLVTMLDIDGKCFIVKKNFHVDVAPEVSFESELAPVIIAPPLPIHHEVNHAALNDIVPNIRGGPRLDENIVELWAEGVEVEDDNEPLDEGSSPPPVAQIRDAHTLPSLRVELDK